MFSKNMGYNAFGALLFPINYVNSYNSIRTLMTSILQIDDYKDTSNVRFKERLHTNVLGVFTYIISVRFPTTVMHYFMYILRP